MPALAVADALRADGDEVVFVGGERAEVTLVPAAGYRLRQIRVAGLSRSNPVAALRAAGLAALAVPAAWRILAQERPAAVLGGGGYVAGPVGLAAVIRRIPLVLTEADSRLGLANRLLAGAAHRVCLAFPIAARRGPRYLVTGRPVPPPATDRVTARAALGVDPDAPLVLVFGGSLGARTINHAAVEAFRDGDVQVLHAAGERDLPALSAPGPHYRLHAYISPLAEALVAADLVVARAGGSIFEIAAHGRPAVLIPYPHASGDHQSANARWMADAGAAVVIPDEQLDARRLGEVVGGLFADRPRLARMAQASATLARLDAARAVAQELHAAATGGRARRVGGA